MHIADFGMAFIKKQPWIRVVLAECYAAYNCAHKLFSAHTWNQQLVAQLVVLGCKDSSPLTTDSTDSVRVGIYAE
jgi:hypothetical protein